MAVKTRRCRTVRDPVLALSVLALLALPLIVNAGRTGDERAAGNRRPRNKGSDGAQSLMSTSVPACRVARAETKPALTAFGERTATIVVAGLGGGPVCMSKTSDWRANLPKFLGIYANANVIVYRPRKRDCFECYSPKRARKMTCDERIKEGVDMLLLVGSGKFESAATACAPDVSWCPREYQDLSTIMEQKWAIRANRTVHFPIRNVFRLVNNRVFNFDVIIDDGSFAKPPGRCTSEALQQCEGMPKRKTLIYIGRIMTAKGQLEFLRRANPELLRGYTIEFYGRPQNPEYLQALKAQASSKNIKVAFLGEVTKGRLAQAMCRSQGIIMYSMDKNPRSVYEGIQAGLPVFVSQEAQAAPVLTAQPFVVEVSRAASQEDFDAQLTTFMSYAKDGKWSSHIREWTREEMTMDAVYTGLCQRMGVCADGKEKFDPWFGEAAVKKPPHKRRAYRKGHFMRPSVSFASPRNATLTPKAKLKLALKVRALHNNSSSLAA